MHDMIQTNTVYVHDTSYFLYFIQVINMYMIQVLTLYITQVINICSIQVINVYMIQVITIYLIQVIYECMVQVINIYMMQAVTIYMIQVSSQYVKITKYMIQPSQCTRHNHYVHDIITMYMI